MKNKAEGSLVVSKEFKRAHDEGRITHDLFFVIGRRIVENREVIHITPALQRFGYVQVAVGSICEEDMAAFMKHPKFCEAPYMQCIRTNPFIQSSVKSSAMLVRAKIEARARENMAHPGALVVRILLQSVKSYLLCTGIGFAFGHFAIYGVKVTNLSGQLRESAAVIACTLSMLFALPLIAQVRRVFPFHGMLKLSIFTWVTIIATYIFAGCLGL